METSYVLAIDQGTTGTTVLLFSSTPSHPLRLLAKATREFPQHYPQAGWVEHDLEEIWESLRLACMQVLDEAKAKISGFAPAKIAAIGITNQRETLCVFDRQSSQPLAKAIVWQCRRSSEICKRFSSAEVRNIEEKTGLPVDPYFSASKITWLLENRPDVKAALLAKKAVVGTIDCYLIHRLSGGKSFVTEASNASRTLLFDIHRGCWDQELLGLFGLGSIDMLPEVRDSAGSFATTRGLGFLPDGLPIRGVLGDQQAALAGQTCFLPGESKCTYGTGAFLLVQLGEKAVASKAKLLTTISWSLAGKRFYALEGSAYIAGAAVQFLRDQLGIITSSSEASIIPAGTRAAPEVYFVPALAGLSAPWWEPQARGAIFGLTRGTSKEQLKLAALEGIALQVGDLLEAMAQDMGKPIRTLRVDGGACSNDVLMQLQADLARLQVERPVNLESTAFGAAIFAALGSGIFSSLSEAKKIREIEKVFSSSTDNQHVEKVRGWKRAIEAIRLFHS